jgi:Flp pilus assembly protein TadG
MRMFSGVTKPIAFLAALARSSKGNILPMTAAAIFLVAGMVGGGVDISRGYMVKNRLQNACDAAALAGRKAADTSKPWVDTDHTPAQDNASARTTASTFFNTNFDAHTEGVKNLSFNTASDDNGATVNGTASADLPTVVMNLFGYDQIPLSVTCTASMGVGNSDVMFVLDNTASMNWRIGSDTYPDDDDDPSRLEALRTAMESFYNIVNTATASTNARIRYAYVPFSSTVNVGGALMALDSSYVADSAYYDTRKPVNWTATGDPYSSGDPTWTSPSNGNWQTYSSHQYTGSNYGADSCNSALPASGDSSDPDDWTASGSQVTGTTTQSFDSARGVMVSATGTRQDYTLQQYKCTRDGSRWSGYYNYQQVRTLTKSETTYTYQDYDPTPVTTVGSGYSNWLYKTWSIDTSTYKDGIVDGSTTVSLPIAATTVGQTCTTDWRGRTSCSGGSPGVGNLTSDVWDGCVIERQSIPAATFAFNAASNSISASDGGSYSGNPYDLDIDMAPTSDTATQWAPLWNDIIYNRGGSAFQIRTSSQSAYSQPSDYCPYKSQIFEDADWDTLEAMLDAMPSHLGFGTYYDTGLLWGARLSSPTGIFSDNVNSTPPNGGSVSRHLIFLTDGAMYPDIDVNTSYGVERMDQRIGNGSTSTSTLTNRLLSRSGAICSAIKARGIRIWVIALSTTLTTDLQNCASSPSDAFEADNADELYAHFQEIAKQVGELRITQ